MFGNPVAVKVAETRGTTVEKNIDIDGGGTSCDCCQDARHNYGIILHPIDRFRSRSFELVSGVMELTQNREHEVAIKKEERVDQFFIDFTLSASVDPSGEGFADARNVGV
jgi:hypothetical protein